MLNLLQLGEEQRRSMQGLLTDRSSCYSLWLTVSKAPWMWGEFCVAVTRSDAEPTAEAPEATDQESSQSTQQIRVSRFVW
jgi:hypothetical protein